MIKYFERFRLNGSLVLTVLLSAFALGLAVIINSPDRWICFLAMFLSTVGDIFLMNLPSITKKFPNCFLIGAVFFAVSHIFYAIAFIYLSQSNGYPFKGSGMNTALVITVATVLFFVVLLVRQNRFEPYYVIFAAIYLLIISINMASIFSFSFHAAQVGNYWRLISAIGVLSFFMSDFIIGVEILGGISVYSFLIWWFYPIGQFLLLIGG